MGDEAADMGGLAMPELLYHFAREPAPGLLTQAYTGMRLVRRLCTRVSKHKHGQLRTSALLHFTVRSRDCVHSCGYLATS